MIENPFTYALELFSGANRSLGQFATDPHWGSVVEWARFEAWRRAGDAARIGEAKVNIEPVADGTAGLPYATGFKVRLTHRRTTLGESVFSQTWFDQLARDASATRVAQGELKAGETFYFKLLAYPRPVDAPAKASTIEVVEIWQPIPLKMSDLQSLTAQATPVDDPHPDDVPVFIPHHVIEETATMTEKAGANETGSILIGHLRCDPGTRQIAVVVTAIIPAKHVEASRDSLTFTAQTWSDVDAALTLRQSDEIILGWAHSHPGKFWCNPQCSAERRRECAYMKPFFSAHDRTLHETVFSKPFHIALVVTNTDVGMIHSLYGWQRALIHPRGFHILNSNRPSTAVAAKTGDPTHEKTCPITAS